MSNYDTALDFFEACETGKGWEGCQGYCHPDASFDSQTGALADISTLAGYCDWMQGLLTPIPDGHYERSEEHTSELPVTRSSRMPSSA